MGVGVEGGVLARFDRNLGQSGRRGAGFMHIAAGAEGIARHHVVAADVAFRGVVGGYGHGAGGHFFGAKGQRQVIDTGGDAPVGLPKGGGAAGAGVFYVDDGNAGKSEAG